LPSTPIQSEKENFVQEKLPEPSPDDKEEEIIVPEPRTISTVSKNTVQDFCKSLDLRQISKTPMLDFFDAQDDMGLKGHINKPMARDYFRLNQILEFDFLFRFKTNQPPIIQLYGQTGSGKSTGMLSLMLKWCKINNLKFILRLVFDNTAQMFDEVLSDKVNYPTGTPFASDEGDDTFGGLNTTVESLDWKNLERRVRALGYPIFYSAPTVMAHQYHYLFQTDGLIRDQNLWVRAVKMFVHDSEGNLRGSLLYPAPREDVLKAYFALPKAKMLDKNHLRNIAKTNYMQADEYVQALVDNAVQCEGKFFSDMRNFEQKLWFIVKTSKFRTKAMAKYVISGYEMKLPKEEEKPKPKKETKLPKEDAKLLEKVKKHRGRPTRHEKEMEEAGWTEEDQEANNDERKSKSSNNSDSPKLEKPKKEKKTPETKVLSAEIAETPQKDEVKAPDEHIS